MLLFINSALYENNVQLAEAYCVYNICIAWKFKPGILYHHLIYRRKTLCFVMVQYWIQGIEGFTECDGNSWWHKIKVNGDWCEEA